MGKITSFVKIMQSEGLAEAIKASLYYLLDIDRINLKNAIRFRSTRILFSCDIEQVLPKSTTLRHPIGIVVGKHAELGENVKINQNVTIGGRGGENPKGQPIIKDNVKIYTGAVVLGNVTLEEGCVVGANSVVLEDVGEGETAVGAPASEL